MAECEICGEVTFTNACNQCDGKFCEQHMLPENHNCPGLLGEKLSPEWFSEGNRTQKIGNAESERPDSDADDPSDGEINLEKHGPGKSSESESDEDNSKESESDEVNSKESDSAEYETVDPETLGASEGWDGNPSPDVNPDGSIATGGGEAEDAELKSDLLNSDSRVISWFQNVWKQFITIMRSVLRLFGVAAVWIGAGVTLWKFTAGAENIVVLQGIGMILLGVTAIKITNTGV